MIEVQSINYKGLIYSVSSSIWFSIYPSGCDFVTAATSQCWSVGKEVAIPLEIRLAEDDQEVGAPHMSDDAGEQQAPGPGRAKAERADTNLKRET